MPTPIKMEQNDDGQVISEDPFFGADVDDLDTDEDVDYGNDLGDEDETETEDETEDEAKPDTNEADDATDEDEDEDKGDEDKGDDEDKAKDEEENTEEDSDDSDEDEDEDDGEEETPKPKEQRIPKQRFDEVNERMKNAEARLLQQDTDAEAARLAEVNEFDFDGKEREYMELVVDSEFDKAQAVRREIRAAEKAQVELTIGSTALANREQTKVELTFADTVKDLEADYPTMAPGAEGFKQELVDEVLSLHEGFVNQGMTADLAIAKAVKYVAKMNDIVPLSEQTEDEPAADDTPAPKKKASKKEIQAKVKAKVKQPGKMPKGTDEVSTDLDSMSEEEFDALPESKKREMRGDFL